MRAIQVWINEFFCKQTETYEWITFFRIAIGSLIFLHFISVLPDFNLLFSSDGVIPSDIMAVFIPNYIITLPEIVQFFMQYGLSESLILMVFKCLYIIFCFSLITGFFPRIGAFILLFMQIALFKGFSFYAYGVDFFTSMSLFYLILIPSARQYSCMKYLRIKSRIPKITVVPYLRLFQIHLSIAYFFSGLGKILGFNWRNGESIWKTINLPYVNDFNFDLSFLIESPILLVLIGWSAIIIELCYPLFIWIKQTRKLWLSLTISMHIGIALVLNLYFFSAIMIIWNLTAFHLTRPKATYSKQTTPVEFI